MSAAPVPAHRRRRLIAINADNGKVCEDFGVKGAVDLTAGIGPFTPGGYYSTSPAAVTAIW